MPHGERERRGRDAEGDDVGERIELAAERRRRLAPARDPAVEDVEGERRRREGGGDEEVAGVAMAEVAHRHQHGGDAAGGVAQGEEVGELEAADHREVRARLGAGRHRRFLDGTA